MMQSTVCYRSASGHLGLKNLVIALFPRCTKEKIWDGWTARLGDILDFLFNFKIWISGQLSRVYLLPFFANATEAIISGSLTVLLFYGCFTRTWPPEKKSFKSINERSCLGDSTTTGLRLGSTQMFSLLVGYGTSLLQRVTSSARRQNWPAGMWEKNYHVSTFAIK